MGRGLRARIARWGLWYLVVAVGLVAAPTYQFETLAGMPASTARSVDGTGGAAHFDMPAGMTVDAAGNLYVAEYYSHVIRKITPVGVVTTLAGQAGMGGSVDGTLTEARFSNPVGIVADAAGNLYVSEEHGHRIRQITPAGMVTTLAGSGVQGSADGTGAAAQFDYPQGLAVDGAGNVYVADLGNHTIRQITPAGVVTTLAGLAGSAGGADGTGTAARFDAPYALVVDPLGNVFVTDCGHDGAGHTIRKITPAGVVTTLAGLAGQTGSTDGQGPAARFILPVGIALDAAGNLYVAEGGDAGKTVRQITPAGVVTTLAGAAGMSGSADGQGPAARFDSPFGIAVNGAGTIYVSDLTANLIRQITPAGGVTTLAGALSSRNYFDGMTTNARFNQPFGVAADAVGTVYVADYGNGALRRISPAGLVSTVARSFWAPTGVAVDGVGNAYVVDQGNHTIRKVTPSGEVATVAGTAGVTGSTDGVAGAALFNSPCGVALDPSGNLYVSDAANNTIRKISPAGVVSTLAGQAGVAGGVDATGQAARFNRPQGLALDRAGNLYVSELWNHTIRKITPDGVVTTLAGAFGEAGSTDGTGGLARFNMPNGLAVDGAGNVLVAEWTNHTLRQITPEGVVTTLAGLAGVAGSVDGAPPAVRFNGAVGVAVDGHGHLYVADIGNNTIRKGVTSTPVAVTPVLTWATPAAITYGTALSDIQLNATANVAGTFTYTPAAGTVLNAGAQPLSVIFTPSDPANYAPAEQVQTLMVNQAPATVTLGGLSATYTGAAHPATATTAPAGLAVTLTYDGAATVPVNAGSYAVQATLTDPNYQGTATSTLVIAQVPLTAKADDQTRAENMANPPLTITYTGFVNGETAAVLATAPVISTPATTTSGPGRYPITLTGGSDRNYTLALQNGTLTVTAAAPRIGAPPANQTVNAGTAVTFSVTATSSVALDYQWQVSTNGGTTWAAVANGTVYSGIGTDTLTVLKPTAVMKGYQYRCVINDGVNPAVTTTAAALTVQWSQFSALSARAPVGTGDQTVILGFVFASGGKPTLVRGVGPGLLKDNPNLAGQELADPVLTLNELQTVNNVTQFVAIASNDNWGGAEEIRTKMSALGMGALDDTSTDAVMLTTPARAVYTAQISGANQTTGLALAEVYDADFSDNAKRLTALSVRNQVGTGSGVLIVGFVLSGDAPKKVIIRGVGPGLVKDNPNLAGQALANPTLQLHQLNTTTMTWSVVGANDDWGGTAELTAAMKAVGMGSLDADSKDAALLLELPAGLGIYTAQLSGVGESTGLGLVEIYEAP